MAYARWKKYSAFLDAFPQVAGLVIPLPMLGERVRSEPASDAVTAAVSVDFSVYPALTTVDRR